MATSHSQPVRGGAHPWPGRRGNASGQLIEGRRPQRCRLWARHPPTHEVPPVYMAAANGAQPYHPRRGSCNGNNDSAEGFGHFF
ncbi:hypothetical protein BHE74_00046107 [Ensete ventricosum]|nr:hypothetical protein BHE74_00046107 [Ensete ventricosum]